MNGGGSRGGSRPHSPFQGGSRPPSPGDLSPAYSYTLLSGDDPEEAPPDDLGEDIKGEEQQQGDQEEDIEVEGDTEEVCISNI